MPSQSRFLVIEGCNGVGKSTIVEYLCARVGASSFHYPPTFVSFRREVHLDESVAPLPRLAYYLAATLHLSDLVPCHLRSLSGKSPFADDRRVGDGRDGRSPPAGTISVLPVYA